uniref:Uncharacterized protein n=1 Tax=Caenorhabditis tropicalis TaxID=1561998 RepID=A0A1I7U4I2_9PELO
MKLDTSSLPLLFHLINLSFVTAFLLLCSSKKKAGKSKEKSKESGATTPIGAQSPAADTPVSPVLQVVKVPSPPPKEVPKEEKKEEKIEEKKEEKKEEKEKSALKSAPKSKNRRRNRRNRKRMGRRMRRRFDRIYLKKGRS